MKGGDIQCRSTTDENQPDNKTEINKFICMDTTNNNSEMEVHKCDEWLIARDNELEANYWYNTITGEATWINPKNLNPNANDYGTLFCAYNKEALFTYKDGKWTSVRDAAKSQLAKKQTKKNKMEQEISNKYNPTFVPTTIREGLGRKYKSIKHNNKKKKTKKINKKKKSKGYK